MLRGETHTARLREIDKRKGILRCRDRSGVAQRKRMTVRNLGTARRFEKVGKKWVMTRQSPYFWLRTRGRGAQRGMRGCSQTGGPVDIKIPKPKSGGNKIFANPRLSQIGKRIRGGSVPICSYTIWFFEVGLDFGFFAFRDDNSGASGH